MNRAVTVWVPAAGAAAVAYHLHIRSQPDPARATEGGHAVTDACTKCGGEGFIETFYEDIPYPISTRCTHCENEDPESSTFENLDEEEGT